MRATGERVGAGMWWDRAWSLVEGCAQVSTGCAHCWSAAASAMRCKQGGAGGERYAGLVDGEGLFNGVSRFMAGDLSKPLSVRKGQVWAVWNDLFYEHVEDCDIAAAFGVMGACSRHLFVVCTKRADVMRNFFARFSPPQCRAAARERLGGGFSMRADSLFDSVPRWPLPNVVLMVSAEDAPRARERVPFLIETPAAFRAVSCEPLLGAVDLGEWIGRLDWVIAGCESGWNRRFSRVEWFESLRDQCAAAGTAFFLKQIEVGMKVWPMPRLAGRFHDDFPSVRRG